LDGGRERFSFNNIVIETSTQHAAALHEWLYELGNPLTATKQYPYTGGYQFVPMLKSKEWPISKIYHLAKIHAAIINDLRPLYLENLQDIHHLINMEVETISTD
jgi:hypothetical protein